MYANKPHLNRRIFVGFTEYPLQDLLKEFTRKAEIGPCVLYL